MCDSNQPKIRNVKEFMKRPIPLLAWLIACSFLTASAAFAQTGTIAGTVTDSTSGAPLPGVNVVIEGTQQGASTGANGTYTISNVEVGTYTLQASFVGYATEAIEGVEVQDGATATVDVAMQPSTVALDEVVAVGYGTQLRSDVTGSVASVSAESIEDLPVVSVNDALAGKVAGVDIQQTSGAPGGGLSIKIRGTGTVTAGSDPLYVIDGVPISNEIGSASTQGSGIGGQQPSDPLSTLNPDDIESIEVLKDASSAAIYGSRGANGVVLITTKQGASGEARVRFSSSLGSQRIINKIDLLSAEQMAEYVTDARNNGWVDAGGSADDPNSVRDQQYKIPVHFQNPSSVATRTDWQDQISQTGLRQDYSLSASGGSESVNYYVSGGYLDQRGVIKESGFERYSLRANVSAEVADNLNVTVRLAPSYTNSDIANAEGIGYYNGLIERAVVLSPFLSVYNEDGSYNTSYTWDFGDGTTQDRVFTNPVSIAEGIDNEREHARVLGNISAELQLLEGLAFESSFGTDLNIYRRDQYSASFVSAFPPTDPSGSSFTSQNLNWLNENTLSYSKTFGEKHSLDALGGFTIQQNRLERSGLNANNFPDNDLVPTLNAGTVQGGYSTASEWSLMSFLGRINYGYDNKYLLTASLRRDGSSRFGGDNRWGVFPSGSVGWRLSEERFLDAAEFLSELKLRASYGVTGNNSIPNYGAIGLLGGNNYVLGDGGGQEVIGLSQSSVTNRRLGWETSRQLDIGLEVGLFNDQIFLTGDVYRTITSDLLLNVPVPEITGFGSALRNIGEVENRGVELTLSTRATAPDADFSWSASLNFSANRNEVLELGVDDSAILSADRSVFNGITHITRVGDPIGSYYGYNQIGVFQSEEQIASRPSVEGARPGDAIIEDADGNGEITEADRTLIGDNNPDFTYGLVNTFSYKDFDLRVQIDGKQGLQVMDLQNRSLANMLGIGNIKEAYFDYWRSPENPGGGTFRASNPPTGRNLEISTHHVEDASYLRLRNVTLGYDAASWLFEGTSVESARIYVSVRNLFMLTDYTGYNPEVNTTQGDPYSPTALTPGIDYGSYPISRTFSLGVDLTL